MTQLETQLSPEAKSALKLIRALRCLPETEGTVAAEKRAIRDLRLKDLNAVALILADDDEREVRDGK
jgi:hypothetical protein